MINKSNRYSRNVITDDKNRSVAESQVRNMN